MACRQCKVFLLVVCVQLSGTHKVRHAFGLVLQDKHIEQKGDLIKSALRPHQLFFFLSYEHQWGGGQRFERVCHSGLSEGAGATADGWSVLASHLIRVENISRNMEDTCCFNVSWRSTKSKFNKISVFRTLQHFALNYNSFEISESMREIEPLHNWVTLNISSVGGFQKLYGLQMVPWPQFAHACSQLFFPFLNKWLQTYVRKKPYSLTLLPALWPLWSNSWNLSSKQPQLQSQLKMFGDSDFVSFVSNMQLGPFLTTATQLSHASVCKRHSGQTVTLPVK